MGYSTTGGPKGLGTFNTTPSTAADFNQIVTLIALMGNLRVGTSSAKAALSGGALFDGLLYYETDNDALYAYNGTSWVRMFSPGTPYAVAAGTVIITPSAANTPTGVAVTFPASRFSVAPVMQVTPDTASPGTVVTGVSASSITNTGATINLTRASTTPTTLHWTALQMTPASAAG